MSSPSDQRSANVAPSSTEQDHSPVKLPLYLPPDQGPTNIARPSTAQDLSPFEMPAVSFTDPFTHFPASSVNSAEEMEIWANIHKADPNAKAEYNRFKEETDTLYEIARDKARYTLLQKRYMKALWDLQSYEIQRIFQSEDSTSNKLAQKPAKISIKVGDAVNFKTFILELIEKMDPEEVGASLLLERYTEPIVVQFSGQTQFSLERARDIFQFSAIERDGMIDDIEWGGSPVEKGKSGSDATLVIDDPYWRLHREGLRFFVAPKTQDKHLKYEDSEDKMWVRDEMAGDIFLDLGWLVEKGKDGQDRTTRYVCALNLSTDPVSMWLIYDYRQPNDYDYLCTSKVPAAGEPYIYLEAPYNLAAVSKAATGKEGGQVEPKGYMDQRKPWDIACLYQNAPKDWPKDVSEAAARAGGPTIFPYGPAKPDLRAKRTKPTALWQARHRPANVLDKE